MYSSISSTVPQHCVKIFHKRAYHTMDTQIDTEDNYGRTILLFCTVIELLLNLSAIYVL